MKPEYYAWVDTETTGLDPFSPNNCRIIELAVVVTDDHLNVVESLETKFALTAADLAAFPMHVRNINGYNEKEWEGAPAPSREIWEKVGRLVTRATLAGQNPTFDAKFITAEMARFGMKPGWQRRMFDTTSLAQYVMRELNVRDGRGALTASLGPVYDALKGPPLPPHRAMADVQRCQYIYKMFHGAIQPVIRATQG